MSFLSSFHLLQSDETLPVKKSVSHLLSLPLTEHVTARFGTEDSHSYAAFAVGEDLGGNFSISLFLRTRRLDGFVLALGNGSSRYLHVWLEDGKVAAQLHVLEILKSKSPVNDGGVHLVSLEVEAGRMKLLVAAQKQGEVEVGSVAVEAGHSVYVGGVMGSRETTVFGGYLKGCVQDLRVNDRRLQFFRLDASVRSFPLRLMENVTAGCPGDNGCRVSRAETLALSPPSKGGAWNVSVFSPSDKPVPVRRDVPRDVGRLHLRLPPQDSRAPL